MSLLGPIYSALRQRFSRDKTRFVDGKYDLDLTYVTDRIIAMAYPGNGMEGTYRNNILDVSAMLNEYHRGHFCIYNLSGRKYDHALFDEKNPECVQDWCYFPDHNPPPLPLLMELLLHMHRFLMADRQNVVVVHCLAGKGRTGTLIACYMMYAGLFSKATEALNFFAFKRSVTINGVSYPGQVRYVTYAQNILDDANPVTPDSTPIYLRSVTLTRVPKLYLSMISYSLGITPVIEIFSLAKKVPEMVFSSVWAAPPESYTYDPRLDGDKPSDVPQRKPIIIPVKKVFRGDLLITLNHCQTLSKQQQILLRLNFHTGFLHFDAKNITRGRDEQSQQSVVEKELLRLKKEEETFLRIKSSSPLMSPGFPDSSPRTFTSEKKNIDCKEEEEEEEEEEKKKKRCGKVCGDDDLYTVTFPKEKLDCISNDDRFPDSFAIVLEFQNGIAKMNPLEEAKFKSAAEGERSLLEVVMGERLDSTVRNGEICFFGVETGEKIARARSQAGSSVERGALIEKKGWLVKKGQKVKSWKKRWFVLRDNLAYFKSGTASAPNGVISLDSIISVAVVSGLCDSSHQYCFEIVVDTGYGDMDVKNMGLRSYLVCASNEDEMNEWVETINIARMERKKANS